jgi:hypothetical protein
MAIQENDIDLFCKLLIPAISWFLVFSCKNYANACEVFLLQWNSWTLQNHPAAAWLRTNFKACSEEYGESAIHNLMTHIREWDYSGDNLKKRWLESSRATKAFDLLGIPRSHRSSGTKWFSYEKPGDVLPVIVDVLQEVMISVAQGEFRAFVPSVGYITDTERTDDISFWRDFEQRIENRVIQAAVHCLKIRIKIRKDLDPDALDRIPMGLIF